MADTFLDIGSGGVFGVASGAVSTVGTTPEPPPALWTPLNINDEPNMSLIYWLSARTGVTESGGLVSSWADQSPNSLSPTQGTGTKQPQYLATGFRGLHPTVRFDGTDDNLLFPVAGPRGGPNYFNLFFVGRTPANPLVSHGMLYDKGLAPNNRTAACLSTSSSNDGWGFFDGVRVGAIGGALSAEADCMVEWTLSDIDPATTSRIWKNGVHQDGFWNFNSATRTSQASLGSHYAGTILFCQCDVTHIVHVDYTGGSPFPDSVRQKIEGWGLWDVGLEGDLPPGHPYESAPPLAT